MFSDFNIIIIFIHYLLFYLIKIIISLQLVEPIYKAFSAFNLLFA